MSRAKLCSVVRILSGRCIWSDLDDPGAALSLIETHAREVQAQRARIEILRLRRVSDRLDAWLDLYGEPKKGEWIAIADKIGVSPPALYRELAKRKH